MSTQTSFENNADDIMIVLNLTSDRKDFTLQSVWVSGEDQTSLYKSKSKQHLLQFIETTHPTIVMVQQQHNYKIEVDKTGFLRIYEADESDMWGSVPYSSGCIYLTDDRLSRLGQMKHMTNKSLVQRFGSLVSAS